MEDRTRMTPRPAPQPGSGPDIEIARRMSREGHHDQAIGWLEREIAESEGSDGRARCATVLGEIAAAAEQSGELELALRAVRLACQTVPTWADLQLRMGRLLAATGRRAEAREALDASLRLNPRYRAARVERALLDAREGRIAEAADALQGLAAESPVAEPVALQQGLRALSEAEFDDASALLRRALAEQDPRLTGQIRQYQDLIGRDEPVLAMQVLRGAVSEHPGYPDLHLLLGVQELQIGAVDDAIESMIRALELNPDFHSARAQLARALDVSGDTDEALAQVQLVLDHDADHAEAKDLFSLWSSRRRPSRVLTSGLRKVS